MTRWKLPPTIKIYEALGSIADGRLQANEYGASVLSSSGNKSYSVTYDSSSGEISSNDNGSYWQGYLGYPAIAYLLATGVIAYDSEIASWLGGIAWKDINTRFKNDYLKTESVVRDSVIARGGDVAVLEHQIDDIMKRLQDLPLIKGRERRVPPSAY